MAKEETGDWYYDSGRHAEDLERALLGAQSRLAELEAMNAHPDELEAAKANISAAKEQLAAASGAKGASKRPARAREKRA